MTLVCKVTVPGEPVPKARARTTPHGTYTPKRTAQAEARFRTYLATLAARGAHWPVDGRLEVFLTFYVRSKRRTDLDNLAKLALDSATGAVWVDDSQIDLLSVERFHGTGEPRTTMLVYLRETEDAD